MDLRQQAVTSDGVTITGDGTALNPLVAVGGGSGTTVTVDITSADILALNVYQTIYTGGGANTYTDASLIFEWTPGVTPYTLGSVDLFVVDIFDQPIYIDATFLTSVTQQYIKVDMPDPETTGFKDLNLGIGIYTMDSVAPALAAVTLGNGTLRAIITYTVRTFGA